MTLVPDNWEGDRNDAQWRLQWRSQLEAKSYGLLERDDKVFMHQVLSTPCLDMVQSAQGSWLRMEEGRKILDLHGNSVHTIGYNHPHVRKALLAQLDLLSFSPRRFSNRIAIEFAERLCTLSNGVLSRILLMPAGTIAISTGLRLARLWSGKTKIVTWWDSFHGATFDNCALSGEDMFRRDAEHLSSQIVHLPSPGSHCPPGFDDPQILDFLARKDGNIGVFLAEGIRHSGVVIPSHDYWKEIRKICDKHGILLFLDDIPCGLGRLGTPFSFQHFGIEPDMVALGKALGGGLYPQAALLMREDANRFSERSLGHFTHEKSPLGSACGLAVLEVLETENLYARASQLGNEFTAAFPIEQYPMIQSIRVAGALIGFELISEELAQETLNESLRRGVSFKIGGGRTLTLNPPLNIAKDDLQWAIQVLRESLHCAYQKLT
jgi:4-aminobutyrate aminotransferase